MISTQSHFDNMQSGRRFGPEKFNITPLCFLDDIYCSLAVLHNCIHLRLCSMGPVTEVDRRQYRFDLAHDWDESTLAD